MLGIKTVDRVRNEKMLEAVGQISLSIYVKRRQLQWVGHTLRASENNLTRIYIYTLYAPVHGRQNRGRPRHQFAKYVVQLTGLGSKQWSS